MSRSKTVKILCDEAELALECAHLSQLLQLDVQPVLMGKDPPEEHAEAYAFAHPPEIQRLVQIASQNALLAMLTEDEINGSTLGLARDLGIAAVTEIRPLLAMLALRSAGAERPWAADLKRLHDVDRVRLGALRRLRQQGGGQFESSDGQVNWRGESKRRPTRLGDARDVLAAVRAMHDAGAARAAQLTGAITPLQATDVAPIREALFGPARVLSDPASKGILARAGVPCPEEHLCTSASRAASEASRVGYPCAISLASPDLRGWDYPELRNVSISSAAAAKTAFEHLRASASDIDAGARIVGVTVAPVMLTQAELRIDARPFGDDRAIAEIGFSDPHGLASRDLTHTVLPVSPERIERILMRLRGHALLLPQARDARRHVMTGLTEVLTTLARLLVTFPDALVRVRVEPLRLLLSGDWMVGEASLEISDHFEKQLGKIGATG